MSNPQPSDNCTIDFLKHHGYVQKIEKERYFISISAQSACSSCHSRGSCSVGGTQEKTIEVPRQAGQEFLEGDVVEVLMKKSMGPIAVVWGYIIPFLLLIFALIIFINLLNSEGLAGILAIGILAVYYLILYVFKNKFQKAFQFSIRKPQ
jgi:sigma-E factor negative regulatory protein RseC